jgi:hypothetical protein
MNLEVTRSAGPLGKLIVAGLQLHSDPQSYIINLIENSEPPEISTALKTVTEEWEILAGTSPGFYEVVRKLKDVWMSSSQMQASY